MKQRRFNQYSAAVAAAFRLGNKKMYLKTKKKPMSDARHMLYYVCSKDGFRISEIQYYLEEKGYYIKHSNIIYGKNSMKEKIDKDEMYGMLADKLCTL